MSYQLSPESLLLQVDSTIVLLEMVSMMICRLNYFKSQVYKKLCNNSNY
ncbi:putative membrane protein [Anaplasma phagocytophilum str. ApNYW]|nr:putative membrane protein [Anaplasma phagocytophilum str. ApNYW]